jgi:hypothetical protein
MDVFDSGLPIRIFLYKWIRIQDWVRMRSLRFFMPNLKIFEFLFDFCITLKFKLFLTAGEV